MSIGLALGFVCQNWASIHGSNFCEILEDLAKE
jgi:hypothetical protein